MNRNYGSLLWKLVVVSIVLLFVGQLLRLDPVLKILLGAAPLAYYHWGYLLPSARRGVLPHAAIDSVYYFGFLVTLGALATSAYSVARDNQLDFSVVGVQFAVGLLATAYAVCARLHLLALVSDSAIEIGENQMGQVIDRSRELVLNIELASAQFKVYVETLTRHADSVISSALDECHSSIKKSADIFDTGVRDTLRNTQVLISDVRTELGDAGFTADRKAFAKDIAALSKRLKTLEEVTTATTATINENVTQLNRLAGPLATTVERLESFALTLDVLQREEGGILKTAEDFVTGAQLIRKATESLEESERRIAELPDSLGDLPVVLKNLRAMSDKATRRMEALNEVMAGIAGVAAQIQSFNASGGEISVICREAADAIQLLKSATQTLNETHVAMNTSASDLNAALKASTLLLEEDVRKSTAAATLLSSRLVDVAQHIIDGVSPNGGMR